MLADIEMKAVYTTPTSDSMTRACQGSGGGGGNTCCAEKDPELTVKEAKNACWKCGALRLKDREALHGKDANPQW